MIVVAKINVSQRLVKSSEIVSSATNATRFSCVPPCFFFMFT